jgi:hypothetical protein
MRWNDHGVNSHRSFAQDPGLVSSSQKESIPFGCREPMTTLNEMDEFCADCNDFELCNTLALVIEEFYGFEALLRRERHIPYERWVIHNIWGNVGFFDCEGYSYFWGIDLDHLGYAEALDEIGFDILSRIIRDYIPLVSPEDLGNWDAVEAHIESEDARDEAADHMDDKLINDHPDFVGKTATYARAIRYSFTDLLDKLVPTLEKHREMDRFARQHRNQTDET